MKNKLSTLLRITISAGLILLLLYIFRDRYDDILKALKRTDIMLLSLGFALFVVACVIASFRLKMIIQAQGIAISFSEAVSLTFIGYFFNNFLPTAIGGDVVKAHFLSKNSGDTAGSYSAIFVDRLIGLVTMVFMAFVALLFVGANIIDKKSALVIYVITGLSVLVIALLANRKFAAKFTPLVNLVKPIERQLKTLYVTINKYRDHSGIMIMTLVMSILSQLSYFACYGLLGLSINAKIPIISLLIKMPIVGIMSLLPSINGLGVREGSIVLLFGPVIGKDNCLAIGILMIFVLLFTSIIGGLIYAISPQFKMKLREIEIEGEAL